MTMLAQKPPGVRVAMRDNWTVLVHAMLESADAFGAKTPALAKLAASLEDDDDDDDADDDDLDDGKKPPPVRKKKKTKRKPKKDGTAGGWRSGTESPRKRP